MLLRTVAVWMSIVEFGCDLNGRVTAYGYERNFLGPLISVRFTPESRHTETQCLLLGL